MSKSYSAGGEVEFFRVATDQSNGCFVAFCANVSGFGVSVIDRPRCGKVEYGIWMLRVCVVF